ncbi:MAG: serine protein kinase RIO [Nitrosopumilaceae archaeon]|nr:serine protein kinase RIO [Nitrosopumilaceae archaeon]
MLGPKLHHRRRRELADGFKKNKVVNEVLDKPTVMTLYRMITGGILSGVNGSVSAGKESLVFWGLGPTGADVALKIYLVSTSNFKRRQAYMEGDPRFTSVKRGTRNVVYLWARKEFRNLTRCAEAGIPVPRPIHVANNVLAMEFIGAGHAPDSGSDGGARGRPAAQLLHWPVDYDDYRGALSMLGDMYTKANLVHGDYSEYNIFKVHGRGLVMFDLGSAVDRRHPNARMLLQRDINNITRFFEKKGVSVDDAGRIMEDITSS